jgi:hypothetical protein
MLPSTTIGAPIVVTILVRSEGVAQRARHRRVVVLTRRSTGGENLSRKSLRLDGPAAAGGEAGLAGDAQHREGAVGFVAMHADDRDVDDGGNLLGNGGEEVVRARALRDQRRDPSQPRLLVGEPRERVARLRVGQSRRDQLREAGQLPLRPRRERAAERCERDRTPQLAVDDDRARESRAYPKRAHDLGHPCGLRVVRVEPSRAHGPANRGDNVARFHLDARAGGMRPAVHAHHGRRSIPLEPDDCRDVGTEQPADLVADGREDLDGRDALRHERRDAAQRVHFVVGGMHLGDKLRHLHLEFIPKPSHRSALPGNTPLRVPPRTAARITANRKMAASVSWPCRAWR